MYRMVTLVVVLAAALVWAGAASAFTKTDARVTMDDGVEIATTLYLPDGAPPAAGWPALMMFHGLAGSRQDMNLLAEQFYANQGFAVLTYDARGHGESGGVVTLDGPREIADGTVLFEQLAARPDVDGTRIGGWGVSYGGVAVWRMVVEGVPFAAIAQHETWTDLYSSLLPQNLGKSGVVFGLVQSIQRPSELVTRLGNDIVRSQNLAELRVAAAARSSLPVLNRVRVPTLMIQGKRDFVFDMEQAISAYRRLAGPKRLYLGNLGHAPSTFASDDLTYFMEQGRRWFDRYLKGMPNGIDTSAPVEVAPTPFARGRIGRYRGLPPTRTLAGSPLSATGRTIASAGRVVKTFALPTAIETFGSATVTVTASTRRTWPHLVAVLSALTPRGEVIVADGGVPTKTLSRRARTFKIRLMSTSTPLPKGSRLRLTLAATSLAQNSGNLVYLQSAPTASSITIGKVSVSVPVLQRRVSP